LSLFKSPILSSLRSDERDLIIGYFQELKLPPLSELKESESGSLSVILEGEARIHRQGLALSLLGPGDCFGNLGLKESKSTSIHTVSALKVAQLSYLDSERLAREHPALAHLLLKAFISCLKGHMEELTNSITRLLKERARPLRSHVEVKLSDGQIRDVAAATTLKELLPEKLGEDQVVAARVNGKVRSLNQPIYAPAEVAPITIRERAGRAGYRRSLGILLMEAAHELDSNLDLRVGSSLGFAHIIEVQSSVNLAVLAKQLERMMRQKIEEAQPFRRERWTLEEARAQFLAQGWEDAAAQLLVWRSSTVPLVSCGELYALELGPVVPDTSYLSTFEIFARGEELLLAFFEDEPRHQKLRVEAPTQLARAHESWLKALKVTSVSAFNARCIDGGVTDIIRVSEGFHEKRISQIADEISGAGEVRIICVSGPSSSGKTTFLKRLSVQLKVNGLTPRGLSLDNYYVDREQTIRDEYGEYDFEAFEALNIPLMRENIAGLLKGEEISTARYDFKTGRSLLGAGPKMKLEKGHVLLLEGIHALNPRLPVPAEGVFRVFINAMTSLPLDRINRVSVSDIRLLRRIVRDRFQRSITASDNIMRWPSVRRGERRHIFPHQQRAHAEFNSSLLYEPAVLKIYAERYLLEVSDEHPACATAHHLRRLLDKFIAIYPDQIRPTSILREFIGGLSF